MIQKDVERKVSLEGLPELSKDSVRKIIWIIGKNFIRISELIRIRKHYLELMFVWFPDRLNKENIKKQIIRKENYWIGCDCQKVRILREYCTILLDDPRFCERISDLIADSNAEIDVNKAKEYYISRTSCLDKIFEDIEKEFYKYQDDIQRIKDRADGYGILEEEGEYMVNKYNEGAASTTLLDRGTTDI